MELTIAIAHLASQHGLAFEAERTEHLDGAGPVGHHLNRQLADAEI